MFRGVLRKMITEKEVPIRYFLDLEDDFLVMNRFLGRNLKITYDGSQCLTVISLSLFSDRAFVNNAFLIFRPLEIG